MIELRALGTLVLRTAAGEDIRSVLAQPKRVALLSYLAIARPRGFHRRDTLLALLWPEQDEQHARWALNQALKHLRTALGREVLASRGDGEVGVEPGLLSCDAVAFESALEAKDYARAMEWYQGDLLEGFHVSDCGEFERWLEEERVWLRRSAARGASSLAQQYAAQGEPVAAGQWARRAFALSPDDEAEIRQLIDLLGRVGDRAGAVQAYEEFARRLRTEYAAEPAPETRALITAVRAREAAREPPLVANSQPFKTDAEGFTTAAPVEIPEPSSRNRRGWRVAAAVGSVLLGIGGLVWGFKPSSAVPANPNSSTIAILPFSYHGAPEFAYLAQGMVELLSAGLSGAGEIRTVDPSVVHNSMRHREEKDSELEYAHQLSTRLQAGSFILGDVFEAGGKLRITARLHSTRGPDDTASSATVQGLPTELFKLLDELTAQVIAGRNGAPAARLTRLAALTTDSLGALKAYLDGERYFREGKSESGVRALEKAVRIDSSFALAQYRLASMAMWSNQQDLARSSIGRAMRFSGRLSYRDRQLISALAATLSGRFGAAERTYSDILGRSPNDFEANYELGELIFHQRSLIHRSWLEAREPLERVLAMEPDHESALYHLSNISAREGRLAELDSLTNRVLQIVPPQTPGSWFFRGQRALARADTAETTQFLAALSKMPEEFAQPAGGLVVFTTADLAVGRRIWHSLTLPSRSSGVRLLAHLTLAQMELMMGRWRVAQTELAAASQLDSSTALEHRALLSLWPLLSPPDSELLGLRNALLRWKPTGSGSDETVFTAAHARAHPYLRMYLLGLLESRLGHDSVALGYAGQLNRLAGSSFAPSFVREWGRAVRAEVARSRGRLPEALALLDTIEPRTQEDLERKDASPFFAKEYEQFARAEVFYALGRFDDALKAYKAIADELFHTGAPAHLRMAEIYERRGDREKAADHYAQFVKLWKDCDPELRPVLEAARRHLEPA